MKVKEGSDYLAKLRYISYELKNEELECDSENAMGFTISSRPRMVEEELVWI